MYLNIFQIQIDLEFGTELIEDEFRMIFVQSCILLWYQFKNCLEEFCNVVEECCFKFFVIFVFFQRFIDDQLIEDDDFLIFDDIKGIV